MNQIVEQYESDNSVHSDHEDEQLVPLPLPSSMIKESTFLKPINPTQEIDIKSSILLDQSSLLVDPTAQQLMVNPTYNQFKALFGPANPFKTDRELSKKNTLTGFVEPTNLDEFNFEKERRRRPEMCGDGARSVFESGPKRPGDKRKRLTNWDGADAEKYTGPWAPFVDEVTVSVPPPEEKALMDEYLAKRAKRHQKGAGQAAGGADVAEPMETKTALHIATETDYQGRSFMLPPLSVDDGGRAVSFRSSDCPSKCFVPKRLEHQWANAHRQGVSVLRLLPDTGHLMLSGGMDKQIRLWELYNERRLIRSYLAHREAIKDVCFNNTGSQFLSSSYDKYIRLFDTETGQCRGQFTNKHIANVVKFNPDPDKQHLFLAGCQNKKILCYDVRSGETVQLYERHLGAVNSITFFDGNKRFVSTSDDRSLRMWEWDIPVDYRVLADPSMHSMPSVNVSRNSKWLVCQSLDNQIVTYNLDAGFKKTKKVFRNQVAAGSACQIDFSPDMKYLISGDGEGKVFVWDFKTTKCVEQWGGHSKAVIAAAWLPHETSKLVTAGWDGHIKLWD